MKIMIFGANGQLGTELIKIFPNAIALKHSDREDGIDITSSQKVKDVIAIESPDIIINTSAMTNVDKCELDKEKAMATNGAALKHISESARSVGAYLIQVSTDYVFDGESGNYLENSLPNPLNYYGLSKLVGENFALSYDNSLVIRTSGVFGHSNNFPLFAFNTLKESQKIEVLDGYYSPIHSKNLAESILEIVETKPTGILNIAGDRISRLSLAENLCEIFGFDKNLIRLSKKSNSLIAKRPFDSSLNIERARKMISFDFHTIVENLSPLES